MAYTLSRRDIVRVIRTLTGVERVAIEDRGGVLIALDANDAGLDFADALHVTHSSRAAAFATFGRRLVKRAKGLALSPAVELLG